MTFSYADGSAALPTLYNGVLYRSRLEARWARCFDQIALRHEYEPQGFKTSFGNYLPDFWLPQLSAFAEVKPVAFTREQLGKCAEVAHGTRCPFVLLVEQPALRWYQVVLPSGDLAWTDVGYSAQKAVLRLAPRGATMPSGFHPTVAYFRAVAAARSARFGT